jgi:2-haloacid dehalogenase
MDIGRRSFLTSSLGLAALVSLPGTLKAALTSRPQVVLFDAFPIFDPRPVAGRVKEMFPAQGEALAELWRTRQFEYTWLRTMSGRYATFWDVTRDALRFSAHTLKLELSTAQEDRLMGAYLELKPWPDAPAALHALKAAGVKLALLSNFTREMMRTNIHGAGLDGVFDQVLSTDRAGAFKPDPRAYQMGLDAFGLTRHEMLFAAFAGWDAAGAKAFGYPTFWVNRLNQPAEELGVVADVMGTTLTDLVTQVRA